MPESLKDAEMQMINRVRERLGLPPAAKPRTDYEMSSLEDREEQDQKLDIGEETKKKIVADLKILIPSAEKASRVKRDQWKQADRNYKGDLPERNFPWVGASNLNVPITKTKLRKLARKLKSAVFRHRPIWPLEAQEESDVERVEKAEKFLDYKGKHEMRIEIPATHSLNDCGRYGTSIMKVPWVLEQEEVTEVETWDGTDDEQLDKFSQLYPKARTENPEEWGRLFIDREPSVTVNVSYKKTIYRGPRPERIHIKNLVFPKGYTDINKMPFFFEKMEKSWDELVAGEDNDLYERQALEQIRQNHVNDKKDPEAHIKKKYTVYEGMWKYAANGDIKEKCLFAVILDEDVYLRGIKYPYKHGRSYYVPFMFIPDADNFYGEAIAEDLADAQKMLNMIFNIAIDSDMANYPTFKQKIGEDGRNFDIERWYPFKVWQVDSVEDFVQMNSGTSANNSINLMELIQRYGDDVSGVSELMSGRESSLDPKAPAAKAQMLLEISQEDMSEFLKWWLMGWNEVCYQICELYSQYGTEGEEFRVLNEIGKPSLEAAPADLRVRPDMEPHGGEPTFSMAGKRIALIDIMERLQADPIIMELVKQDPRGYFKLWESIVENSAAGLGKKVHEIIPNRQMVEEFQIQVQQEALRRQEEEKMAALQQQMIAAQGGPPQMGQQMPVMMPPGGGM